MVFNVKVALAVGCKIVRAVVAYIHVCIPLHIIDAGVLCHQVVEEAHDEILHLWISEVEHHLSAATAKLQVTFRRFNHPFGMLLVELAHCVRHFGLIPDAKVDSDAFCLSNKSINTVG